MMFKDRRDTFSSCATQSARIRVLKAEKQVKIHLWAFFVSSAVTCSVNFTQIKTIVRQTDDKERSGFTVNKTDERDVYFQHPAPSRRELCEFPFDVNEKLRMHQYDCIITKKVSQM